MRSISLWLLLATFAVAREPIPDKLVVLTFDDASKSHYTVARPLLQKYKFGATFFITEGWDFATNKKDYLSWDEIKQLHADGFEIGNHTRDHLGLGVKTVRDYPAQLRAINARCKERGIPEPVSFAYPGNAIAKEGLPVLKELGIKWARRGGSPEYPYKEGRGIAYEPGLDHPLLIPTAGDARPTWSLDDLKRAVALAHHGNIAVLQFHGVPDTAHDWVTTSKEQFEAYLKYLADEKFTVIAMRDLAKYVDPDVTPSDPWKLIDERKKRIEDGSDRPITQTIRVSKDGTGFVRSPSNVKFIPWGFNYDHDVKGRLIEDYWVDEWDMVKAHFGQMKELGANVVRIHLQFGKFMDAPDKPNAKALDKLGELLKLAETTGFYLDLTGLACYHKADVPAWYDKLNEKNRWAAQARFWEAIADRCKDSPAVFCYDLMNEPVVPGGKRKDGEWLGPPFGDKHFVQVISLDQAERKRPDVARAWIRELVSAIRKHDKTHLVTVGLVDWSLDKPGLTSGFVPKEIVGELDFLCVHLYPKTGKVDEAIATLKGFTVGKPVVIEETFPLGCTRADFEKFLERADGTGVIGFYWGVPPAELRKSKTIGDAIVLSWLEVFQKRGKAIGVNPRE
ncbi:MAG TPA: polysaccharide deacetylase family protein [Gemmataceae bacterium]|jgi:peptidoglycan/xylan/chitin deacetylase (PgdA/CDA1 family)|nr:polysaccharide deacetylase family protein [Gemmataceae bacterium]